MVTFPTASSAGIIATLPTAPLMTATDPEASGSIVAMQTDEDPPIQWLPDEVLMSIFSRLSFDEINAAGKVCKRWQSLAQDETLWNRLLRHDFSKFLSRNVAKSHGDESPKQVYIQNCLSSRIKRRSLFDQRLANGVYTHTAMQLSRHHENDDYWTAYGSHITCQTAGAKQLFFGNSNGFIFVCDIVYPHHLKHVFSGPQWVRALIVDKKAQRLFASFSNNEIAVFNLNDKINEKMLSGHVGLVSALASNKKGKLISGDVFGVIKIWNWQDGACEATLIGHIDKIISLIPRENGDLISCDSSGAIRMWNTETGRCANSFQAHSREISTVVCTSDSKLILGSSDKTIEVWDLEKGECEMTLAGHEGGIKSLALTKENKLISRDSSNAIKIWDLAEKEIRPIDLIWSPFFSRAGGPNFDSKLCMLKGEALFLDTGGSYIGIMDFAAPDSEVCKEIAWKMRDYDTEMLDKHDGKPVIMHRFNKLPEKVKAAIYYHFKVLKYWGRVIGYWGRNCRQMGDISFREYEQYFKAHGGEVECVFSEEEWQRSSLEQKQRAIESFIEDSFPSAHCEPIPMPIK